MACRRPPAIPVGASRSSWLTPWPVAWRPAGDIARRRCRAPPTDSLTTTLPARWAPPRDWPYTTSIIGTAFVVCLQRPCATTPWRCAGCVVPSPRRYINPIMVCQDRLAWPRSCIPKNSVVIAAPVKHQRHCWWWHRAPWGRSRQNESPDYPAISGCGTQARPDRCRKNNRRNNMISASPSRFETIRVLLILVIDLNVLM